MKELLLNITPKEKRCAVVEHGKLQDLIVERERNRQLSGNIYRGQVINILHNIQSAFIDIGEAENGFIHIDDIVENMQKFQEMFDMEFDWDYDMSAVTRQNIKNHDIAKFMEIGRTVLVQVVKEPMGSKGARLTSNIAIPGRYLVLLPNTPHRGVSLKISDRQMRDRLKEMIRAFEMPQKMGLICRTASANATIESLAHEAHELLKIWEQVVRDFHNHQGPACLYRESDFVKKAVLMAVNERCARVLIDDYRAFQYCRRLYKRYREEHPLALHYYREEVPLFERFHIENEIERCLRRKVWLKNGSYLFFDSTEAMYTIDVNSGRSSSPKTGIGVEEALVQINIEAAEEIARQLRIRRIGGLIICDFIDMRSRRNQRRVLNTLREAMRKDLVKCTILGMSEFGLVEMTRQRTRESLIQTLLTHCPYCMGKGMIKSDESISIEIRRAIEKLIRVKGIRQMELSVHPKMKEYLDNEGDPSFQHLAKKWRSKIEILENDAFHLNAFEIRSSIDGQKLYP